MPASLLKNSLPPGVLNALRRWRVRLGRIGARTTSSAEYWTRHHVDAPDAGFAGLQESLDHYAWRNIMYPGTLELMPVSDADGMTVLDYGCGPGNDVIGFCHYSRPAAMHAVDVSPTALALAKKRAALHGFDVGFRQIAEGPVELPFADATFDLVHSAGVIHHTPDPIAILCELRRVLKPTGRARIMVYNRDSVWMHLFVAYESLLVRQLYPGQDKDAAFRRTTDGDLCPIANCYKPGDFVGLCEQAGFRAEFAGAGISLLELDVLSQRIRALQDKRLDAESRAFLYDLTFNDRLWPLYRGRVAGLNGCYHLTPA